MNKRAYLLLLLPSAMAYACGTSDDTIPDGGSPDALPDTTVADASKDTGADSPIDAPADTTVSDASNDAGADAPIDGPADSGGDAGSDSGINLACLHPADCFDGGALDAAYPPDAGEVCCGTLVTTGVIPSCSFVSLTTQCVAPSSCGSSISLFSCGTDTVRGCQHASECVETGYDECCTFNGADAGYVSFCVGATVAQFAVSCYDAGQ
jgi:hypothetical protein